MNFLFRNRRIEEIKRIISQIPKIISPGKTKDDQSVKRKRRPEIAKLENIMITNKDLGPE